MQPFDAAIEGRGQRDQTFEWWAAVPLLKTIPAERSGDSKCFVEAYCSLFGAVAVVYGRSTRFSIRSGGVEYATRVRGGRLVFRTRDLSYEAPVVPSLTLFALLFVAFFAHCTGVLGVHM